MLVYSLTKFVQLIKRHNPQVASFVEEGNLDASFVFNFKEQGVRFAFGVEGFLDKETKEDSRYVKGIARLRYQHNGIRGESIIPYHPCIKEELDKFA